MHTKDSQRSMPPLISFLRSRIAEIPFAEFSKTSSSVSYFLILSVVPFLVLIIGIVTLVGQNADLTFMMKDLKNIVPEQIYSVVTQEINRVVHTNAASVLSIGALGMIWSSSSGLTALLSGLAKMYAPLPSPPQTSSKSKGTLLKLKHIGFLDRVMGIFLALFLILGFLLSFILGGIGRWLIDQMALYLPQYAFLSKFLNAVFLLLPFVYMWLIITLIYRMAVTTSGHPGYRKGAFIGALIPAFSWVLISLGLSWYMNNMGRYSIIYGSLGGLAVFLLWIYWCCYALMLGAYIHAHLPQNPIFHKANP